MSAWAERPPRATQYLAPNAPPRLVSSLTYSTSMGRCFACFNASAENRSGTNEPTSVDGLLDFAERCQPFDLGRRPSDGPLSGLAQIGWGGSACELLERRSDRQPCRASILYECMCFLIGHFKIIAAEKFLSVECVRAEHRLVSAHINSITNVGRRFGHGILLDPEASILCPFRPVVQGGSCKVALHRLTGALVPLIERWLVPLVGPGKTGQRDLAPDLIHDGVDVAPDRCATRAPGRHAARMRPHWCQRSGRSAHRPRPFVPVLASSPSVATAASRS
ncbi:hypothetical protein ACVJGD_004435 [Bradyrhizobium sp. USDA 10063]